jgi:hypothetical protein
MHEKWVIKMDMILNGYTAVCMEIYEHNYIWPI